MDRPDNATIFVVGDTSLAEIQPMLEARFGDWAPPAAAQGVKQFATATAAGGNHIYLIDKPQSPQWMILPARRSSSRCRRPIEAYRGRTSVLAEAPRRG